MLIQDDYCLAVFFDISQAFDTVWHHGLLKKLKNMGLEGHLPYFIQQFPLARRIQVRNEGVLSQAHPLLASVPQGAVLSPTLFNIIINDLFDKIPKNVEVSQFADDGALYKIRHLLSNFIIHSNFISNCYLIYYK